MNHTYPATQEWENREKYRALRKLRRNVKTTNSPSFYNYDRRDFLKDVSRRERIQTFTGFLVLIVLTLGIVFLLWELFTFPVIEAAPVVDDQYICENLEEYDIDGMEA